jgi:hypothetical protein
MTSEKEVTKEVDVINQERGEREIYKAAEDWRDVLLPLTRDGFEALLERATSIFDLPIDDNMRCVMAGYIHHLDREQTHINVSKLSNVLRKTLCNRISWVIDQEAKQRNQEAVKRVSENGQDEPGVSDNGQDEPVPDETEKPIQH